MRLLLVTIVWPIHQTEVVVVSNLVLGHYSHNYLGAVPILLIPLGNDRILHGGGGGEGGGGAVVGQDLLLMGKVVWWICLN